MMQPFQATARLAGGIAHTGPWGIALDGLLAAEMWARQKASWRGQGRSWDRARDTDVPPDLDLPLARCHLDPDPELWHWAATCGWPGRDSLVEVRTWTGGVDHRDLEQTSSHLPRVISARQGRYRRRRMPLLVTLTDQVIWQGVGEIDQIAELLEPIRVIGKKRTHGEGEVLAWQIRPVDVDDYRAGHLHPDGSLGRTCTDRCLRPAAEPVVTGGRGMAGIRPPYMHPARQHDLVLPARDDAET